MRRHRRRKTKELPLGSREPQDPNAAVWSIEMLCEDFQATLSPQEKKLCRYQLQSPAERRPCPFSPANVWKLTERIMGKWRAWSRREP